MYQLGFLHSILVYAWPTSIFLKTWVSTLERIFFAPRRLRTYLRKISYTVACLFTDTRHGWHNQPCYDRQDVHKSKWTRKGHFGKFKELLTYLFKTRDNVCSRLDWDISFFYQHSLPIPNPLWKAILVSKFLFSAPLRIVWCYFRMCIEMHI